MGKVTIFLSLFFFALNLWSCESVNYVKSEIGGSAKPTGGIDEIIPHKKSYPVSNTKLRLAIIELLDEQGYIYDENLSTGTIRTDPQTLTDQRDSGISGATYYSKLIIKTSGSTVIFRARFNKDSNLVQDEQNLVYPEKENELRRNFYMALDKKLGVKSSYQNVSNQGDIYKIQKRLTELGYEPGPTDGVMGERTKKAIMMFQKDNNLPASGKIDNDTIHKLEI